MSGSVRFIHCGGFQFDSRSQAEADSSSDIGDKELWQIFEAVLVLCRIQKADFLFITGDMFDQEDVRKETVGRIAKKLAKIKGTRVFITPGEKDPLVDTSAYRLIEWPENVHIFSGGLCHERIPSLETTIYGSGWTTYHQDENFLRGFQTTNESGRIRLMLLHAEVEAERNSEGFIPILREQINNSGLTYLALGHLQHYSGIQVEGETHWADCGSPLGGVIIGETDGDSTRLEYRELAKFCNLTETLPLKDREMLNSNSSSISIKNAIDVSFPALDEVFASEIQNHLNSDLDNRSQWKLVQRIGMSAIQQAISDLLPEDDITIVSWPDITEDEFYRRLFSIKETGNERLCLAKAQDSLERAKNRVIEQVQDMTYVKEEYDALRREWDAEKRRQEEQRLVQIEMQKLEAKKQIITDKVSGITNIQERLSILRQNPDYRELRKVQGELTRLDELRREKREELTTYTHQTQVNWEMIENLKEECLRWAGIQEEAEKMASEIQQWEKDIKEIHNSLALSGYEDVSENEDQRLLQAQEERDNARDELSKIDILAEDIIKKERIYNMESAKLKDFGMIDKVAPADELRIRSAAQRLTKWQDLSFSGYLDRVLNEKFGLRGIEAILASRLNRYCQKYHAADYPQFKSMQNEFQQQQRKIEKLRTELTVLREGVQQEQELHRIIRTRSQLLKNAFEKVKASDLQEWLDGWNNYRLKQNQLQVKQEELHEKKQLLPAKEEELIRYAGQLRDKLKDWVPPTSDVDEVLEVVMIVARKLRAKEEAEKLFGMLQENYSTQLGNRDIDKLAKVLEPIADLEREGCIDDHKRLADLNACQQELSQIDLRLEDAVRKLEHSRVIPLKPDLEKKIDALKKQWKAYEELHQALDNTIELLEVSHKRWRTKYGQELDSLAETILASAFSLKLSHKKQDVLAEAKRYYFAYRISLVLLSNEIELETPLYFIVQQMKEPLVFWEEALDYLQELSLSRKVIFRSDDSKLLGLAKEKNIVENI